MTPLLSVIIPTFRRPEFLKRAIASALHAAPDGDVEVLVVPNGSDDSWKSVAIAYQKDPRVSWHYLETGHACAARNHGLALARGKYVRFLDDDDYLYSAAADQLELIESRGADLCSAPLEGIQADGRRGIIFQIPDSNDLPTVALLSVAISLTQGSIFRRETIKGLAWNNNIVLYDDYIWMLRVAEKKEIVDWFKTAEPVGAYTQHDGTRLSRILRSNNNLQPLVAAILQLHDLLVTTDRLSPERAHAVATALLTHAYSSFPSSPFFLSKVINRARSISPSATPTQKIFRDFPWLASNLLAAQWAMIAPRYLTRGYRRLSWFVKGMLRRAKPHV